MSTKIKTITKKENTFNGKTSTSYTAVLEDGTTGYLDGKVAPNFREGDPVECSVEVKQNKKGGNYNMLTLTPATHSSFTPTGGNTPQLPSKPAPQAPVGNLKAQTRAKVPFTAMDKVIDLYIAGKVTYEKIKEYHTELCNILYDEIENRTFEG